LAFPVALIQGSNKVLELKKSSRLSDLGNLVFEAVRETFVIKAGQSCLISTGTTRVSVEFQGVAHSLLGVLVPESLNCGHGIIDQITCTKEALEFRQEQCIKREPFRKLHNLGYHVIEFGLEPIEQSTLQEREDEGNARFIIMGKSSAQVEMYIEHWKTKVLSLVELEPSKVSGVWGLIEVEGLRVDDILLIFRASNASEQARLGASSGSSSGSSSPSESSPGSGVSFGLSEGGWFAM
jgi:hypothetical protein